MSTILDTAMRAARLTNAELGRRTSVTGQMIGHVRHGKLSPSPLLARRIVAELPAVALSDLRPDVYPPAAAS